MHRQLDLLAIPRIGFDASFTGLRRTELADGAWVDHIPSWVMFRPNWDDGRLLSGNNALFLNPTSRNNALFRDPACRNNALFL